MKPAILVVSALAVLAAPNQAQQIKSSFTNPNPPAAGHVAPSPEGTVLWDQTATTMQFGFVDQVFTDYGTYDTFQVNDVSVPAGTAWNVNSVTTSFTAGQPGAAWSPATITSARLQVYPKVGPLPSNTTDIAPEYTVPATLTLSGGSWLLTADTSGIAELQSITGEFWIGLTPVTAFLTHGQEFHWKAATQVGDDTAKRNPGGAFGLGTTWTSISVFDVPVTAGPPYESTILLVGDVLGGPPGPFVNYGTPNLISLLGEGTALPGSDNVLRIDCEVPGTNVMLVASLVPSDFFKADLGLQFYAWPFVAQLVPFMTSPATGQANVPFPLDASLAPGTQLFIQVFGQNSVGNPFTTWSDGLQMTIQ